MQKKDLESKIESYLKSQVKAVGGLAYKFKSTVNGVPDQIVLFKGQTHFVEVKRPDEEPRPDQVHTHQKFKQQGIPVYTVDDYDQVDDFLQTVLKAEPVKKISKPSQPTRIRNANAFKQIN